MFPNKIHFSKRSQCLDSRVCRAASPCQHWVNWSTSRWRGKPLLKKLYALFSLSFSSFSLSPAVPAPLLSVSLTHSVSCTHRAWTPSSRLRAWRMDLSHTHPRGVFEEWILDFRLWGSFPPGLSRGRSLANELKPERTAGNNKKSPKFRKPRQQSQMSWSHWFFFFLRKSSLTVSVYQKPLCPCVHSSSPEISLRKSRCF